MDTSQQGQAYLQLHPEMWQYFDQQQQEQSPSSQRNYNKLMGGQDVVPETIPSYPASAMMPGAISSGNVYGYPLGVASNIYDLSSQPEMTEEVKYPLYHNVRKHGNYGGSVNSGGETSQMMGSGVVTGNGGLPQIVPVSDAEVAVGMSNGNGDGLGSENLNINLNRRQYQELTGDGNQPYKSHHRTANSMSGGNGGIVLSPQETPVVDVSNGLSHLGGVGILPSSSVVGSSRKAGELSPEELWANYYRSNVGEDDGRGGVGNGAIVDDSFVESKRDGKYLPSSANDPYEKRSGGSRTDNSRVASLLNNENDRLDPRASIFSRSRNREFYNPENDYMSGLRESSQPAAARSMDIGNAIIEQQRHIIQRQLQHHQQQLENRNAAHNHIPTAWNKQSSGTYENIENFRNGGESRFKRHIGAHDNGGIQRLISTGTLEFILIIYEKCRNCLKSSRAALY